MGIVGAPVAFAMAVTSVGGASVDAHAENLSVSARGAAVPDLNFSLAAAGFQPDTGNRFGARTRHAVDAFQKHDDLATTGTFSPLMSGLLEEAIQLAWRPEPDRIVVGLAKQVLYVVEDRGSP